MDENSKRLEDANRVLKWIGWCLGITSDMGLVDNGAYEDYYSYVSDAIIDMNTMPFEYEWPRFEDLEPVRIGDWFVDVGGDERRVAYIEFHKRRLYIHTVGEAVCHYSYGERVKRPVPKVLDADGVEVEVGDDLYSVEGSLKFHVSHVDRTNGKIATDAMFAIDKWADPSLFSHRAPVIAADGEPLEVGQTVWVAEDGNRFHVFRLCDDGLVHSTLNGDLMKYLKPEQLTHQRPVFDADGAPINVGDTVWYRGHIDPLEVRSVAVNVNGSDYVTAYNDYEGKVSAPAEFFTRTKPESDTWERIEDDAECTVTEYNERRGTIFAIKRQVARDLVRRCKEVARKENNNE